MKWIFSFVFLLVLLEFSPYLIMPLLTGVSYSRSDARTELFSDDTGLIVEDSTMEAARTGFTDVVINPYIGFTSNQKPHTGIYGFPGADPELKSTDDNLNLVLMGGSVAWSLYFAKGDYLKEKLTKLPQFEGKQVNITVFAYGGFKQPQQLMALTYFMSLGAEYDYVINLDGFNEIVLPLTDNKKMNTFYPYPRNWKSLAQQKLDPKVLELLGEQKYLNRSRWEKKEQRRNSILRFSNLALMFWQMDVLKTKSRIAELDSKIVSKMGKEEYSFQVNGPIDTTETGASLQDTMSYVENMADLWMRSSIKCRDACEMAGTKYLHFLQPNQYVPDSKTFTEEELRKAYATGEYTYRRAVQLGYPLMIERGKTLTSKGVRFYDLTMFFKSESKSVYVDKCCHFNKYGYEKMADEIMKQMVATEAE